MTGSTLGRRDAAGTLGLLALALFAGPWLLGFGGYETSASKAAVLGAAFALLAFAAYADLMDWAARGAAALGGATVLLAFLPGMHETGAALWFHLGVGVMGLLVAFGLRRHLPLDGPATSR